MKQLNSWRPVLIALVESQPAEQAADAILLLLPQILGSMDNAPASSPPTTTRRRSLTPAPPPPPFSPEALATFVGELPALEFFTVDQAASFLGLGRARIYQILQRDPDKLPHQRNGRDYLIRGRELNKLRAERANTGGVAADVEEDEKSHAMDAPPP